VAASTVATTGNINIVGGDFICDGDMTAETLVTQGNITATVGTSIIHGNTLLSDTNISCGAGGNYFVGGTRLASSNLLDGSLLLNTSATAQTKAGTLTASNLSATTNVACGAGGNFLVGATQIASSNLSDVSTLLNTSATGQIKTGTLEATELRTTNGAVNFTAGTGANIQNDTGNNVLITSTTNLTDGMNWRLGTGSDDALRLRYDENGGGAGVARYFLEMRNPTDSQYYAFSGNSPYDVAGLTTLLNNTSLTFNATTITTFNGEIFYPQPSFTTFASAGFYTGAPTTFIDTVSRFPLGILTETYGTTSKITMRGCCQLRAGGTIAANTTIASIPVGSRPSVDVVVAVQGQTGSEQGRVDFLANGNVDFIGPDATFTQINFSQISYFLV